MTIFLLCLKIFFVRIIDVSLGTFRTIITVKGKSFFASLIGFIEVFVWFMIVREALNTEVTSIWVAVSYSLGFATGTFIGAQLSKKFIDGNLHIQIITSNNNLAKKIRDSGFGITIVDIKGKDDNEKYMLLIEIKNKSLKDLRRIAKEVDKDCFFVVSETKYVQNGFIK